MRPNPHLLSQSDLLAILVEKIETAYADDISLLICYGSFITGDHSRLSDIDFFFVPGTERGFDLNHQFIIGQIGYDLWAVSWEKLERIAGLDDQPASILMDGQVLYAASSEDLARLEALRNTLQNNLKDQAVTKRVSARHLQRAKAAWYDLHNAQENLYVRAVQLTETLLEAVAVMNGIYLKKGLKKVESELDRMAAVPAGFLESYHKWIRTGSRAEILQTLNEMILAVDALWRQKYEPDQRNTDPADLAGFYEEFKSTYNKLLRACDEQNYADAFYAAYMVDRETQAFLTDYVDPGTFPALIPAVLTKNFEVARSGCLEHEQQLITLLNGFGIQKNIYADMHEFSRNFLPGSTV